MKKEIQLLLQKGMLKEAIKILTGKIHYNRNLVKAQEKRIDTLEDHTESLMNQVEALEKKIK